MLWRSLCLQSVAFSGSEVSITSFNTRSLIARIGHCLSKKTDEDTPKTCETVSIRAAGSLTGEGSPGKDKLQWAFTTARPES